MNALFPNVDVNNVGKGNDQLTPFEQLSITKMRFRRRLELTFLGFVWHDSNWRLCQ